jgi:hypothetical protein
MWLSRRLSKNQHEPLVLAAAVVIVALAACIAAGQPNGVVTAHRSCSVPGFHPSLDDSHQQSLLCEALTAGAREKSELALRQESPSGGSVARTRRDAGSFGTSCFSRRFAESRLALPVASPFVHVKQRPSVVEVSWPMGQSAAKFVILLRRLLI